MLVKVYFACLTIFLCEAHKLGLGNGRPSEEPSTLKTEIMKYKSEECGSSSSEESFEESNKNKHGKHKKDSDESDSDESDDSEEKKKKNHGQHGRGNSGNRHNKKNNGRNYQSDKNRDQDFFGTGFGDQNRMMHPQNGYANMDRRPPPEDFFRMRLNPGGDYYQNRSPQQHPPGPYQYPNGPQDSYQNRGPYSNRDRDRYPKREEQDDYFPQRNDHHSYGANHRPNKRRDSHEDRDYDYYRPRHDRNDRFSQDRHHHHHHQKKWDDDSSSDESDYHHDRKNNHKRTDHQRSRNKNNNGRNKKNNHKHESFEEVCVTQCVFNNMQIMEDDGIPSESAMVKWAQDKIKNEKLKATATKDIRKCFGQLASSDSDNSCNFSKSLSACLKLGLDEDED